MVLHELAIAQSIISTVQREIECQKLPPVTRIVLRIGVLSDVVPESLAFNFEAITKNTPLEHTGLTIESVPLRGRCQECLREFDVQNLLFRCPACESRKVDITQGQELDIAYLEVED